MNAQAPVPTADATAAAAIDSEFLADEALRARRKEAGARRFHTVQVPALRAAGFVILSAMVFVQDLLIGSADARAALIGLVAANLAYAIGAWILLARGYGRTGRLDLSLLIFHLDLLMWLANLRHLEQGHAFFAYFLLVRVVDQAGFGFRRALYFGHVVTLAYVGYSVVVAPAGAPLWPDRAAIAATMYLLGVYFALTGLVTERLRERTRRAVRTARELVQSLQQKTAELELQAIELQQARQLAEDASHAKTRFLAVTSHELRTPMNGILGAMELLSVAPLSPQQRRYVQIAQRSATSLLSLIDDVLDVSSIEAGRLKLVVESVDLRGLAVDAVELVATAARGRPITIDCHIDPGLPPRVRADPQRLRQMLLNLLHNAVKFTERGAVVLQVGVSDTAADPLQVRLSVRDTGIGIPHDQLDSIFGAFAQVDDSSTRRHGGTGLGLAIVRELAETMGGSVHVRSELGKGSLFWVDLPLERAAEVAESRPAPLNGNHGLPIRVLLAEDDPLNRALVKEMLERLGCDVDAAEDGEAAWQVAAAGRHDIAFMDCHMPVMDGYEATRRIRFDEQRRRAERLPVVALTADSAAADRAACHASGMDDFMSKPVRTAQLASMIERWTGRTTLPVDTQW